VANRSVHDDQVGTIKKQDKERGQLQVTVPLSFAVPLTFTPFEIKTLRVEKDGRVAAVRLIEETPA
jgi:hypothetical protein